MTRKEHEADPEEMKTTNPEKMARQDFDYRRYNPAKWPDYLAGWRDGYTSTSTKSCGPQVYEQGWKDGAAVREGRDAHPGRNPPQPRLAPKDCGDPGYEIVTAPGERPVETAVRVLQELSEPRVRLAIQVTQLLQWCNENNVHLHLDTQKCGDCDHMIDTIALSDNGTGETAWLLTDGRERFPEES